jgi:internalin A
MPENRYQLRQTLRELQKAGKKAIPLTEYLEYTKDFEREVATDLLKNWLVVTGVVFYREKFGDEVILDQAWAINAIYTLYRRTPVEGEDNTTYYQIQKDNGRFTGKTLKSIWKTYSSSEQNSFIKFMLACELCFETTEREYTDLKADEIKALPFEKRHFIAPQMMSEIMPKSIEDSYLNKTKNWYLNYEHELWHYGILQSFIVETQSWADTREIWQLGILLKVMDGNSYFFVHGCWYLSTIKCKQTLTRKFYALDENVFCQNTRFELFFQKKR